MKGMVIYSATGSVTGKSLANALGYVGRSERRALAKPNVPSDIPVILYGVTDIRLNLKIKGNKVLNPIEAIRAASGKMGALKKLDAANVLTVPTFKATTEVRPVYARKFIHHGGTDIVVVHKGENVPPTADFCTAFVPSTGEYRVHVLKDRIVHAQRKRLPEDTAVDKEEKDFPIRNHLRGWKFISYEPKDLDSLLYTTAVMAVATLGLDFGAVDILYGKDKKYYVLEVNTAPGLEAISLAKWVEAFNATG